MICCVTSSSTGWVEMNLSMLRSTMHRVSWLSQSEACIRSSISIMSTALTVLSARALLLMGRTRIRYRLSPSPWISGTKTWVEPYSWPRISIHVS